MPCLLGPIFTIWMSSFTNCNGLSPSSVNNKITMKLILDIIRTNRVILQSLEAVRGIGSERIMAFSFPSVVHQRFPF